MQEQAAIPRSHGSSHIASRTVRPTIAKDPFNELETKNQPTKLTATSRMPNSDAYALPGNENESVCDETIAVAKKDLGAGKRIDEIQDNLNRMVKNG